MISQIIINNVATYSTLASVNDLQSVNYFFGANGTGKTTISRVINQEYEQCQVKWSNATPLDVFVYNQDFVERNFNQANTVKGVFTLGDNQVEAEKKIAGLQPDIEKLSRQIDSIKTQLHGGDGESGVKKKLADLEPVLRDSCWKKKQLYDPYFQVAFKGVRNNAENFKARVLLEKDSNTSELLSLDEIKERAETIFAQEISEDPTLTNTSLGKLISIEKYQILRVPIIGNKDVDISALIDHLGNSDWVKQGIEYHNKNPYVCPFCQQATDQKLSDDLNRFFSGYYEENIETLRTALERYKSDADVLLEILRANYQLNNRHLLKDDVFESEVKALSDRLKYNQILLEKKLEEPSQKISLEPISDVVEKIQRLISSANRKSVDHNSIVKDINIEKTLLISQVWRFVLEELSGDISRYEKNKDKLNKAITGLQSNLDEKSRRLKTIEDQVKELEKQITSIHPTKDSINSLLKTFGFDSFYIDVEDERGHYRICRRNGDDASRSLSEGEKTFITFLYFYSLIKGAFEASGTTTSRIVVFDDPISSLDSDILFIVSSLMKAVIDDVRNNIGSIRQVFVLTHNVYFHKEVTYRPDRNVNGTMRNESFWVVKKQDQGSIILRCAENPVRSAYELLWDDVKQGNVSSVSLQNTLRRIVENYFTMWGGKSKDEICELFEGQDKLVCKSLFSWVNDGSHSMHDDLYINHGEQTNQTYLRVFKEIFEKSNQIGHYDMMTGNESEQVLDEKTEEVTE